MSYKKDRKRLLNATRRMKDVMDDTSNYFKTNVKHVDDFKVLLTFFRSCHKWSEMLSFVAMCDELTCHEMSIHNYVEDLFNIANMIERLRSKETTQEAADEVYNSWPFEARRVFEFMQTVVKDFDSRPLNMTLLRKCQTRISRFNKTRTVSEHKYEDVYEDRYGIPDIEWSGIIKDGETYFADNEDLWDKNLYELCMIVSARMSRLYVELVNKVIPMAHATIAFDEIQARFDMSCNAVKVAFETETKNGL